MSRKNKQSYTNTVEDHNLFYKNINHKSLQILEALWSISKIWLAWITIHFICSSLYSEECSGRSIWKIIASPMVSQTPPCKGLLWCINTANDAIKHMWMMAGGWIVFKLNSIFKYKED